MLDFFFTRNGVIIYFYHFKLYSTCATYKSSVITRNESSLKIIMYIYILFLREISYIYT